MFLEQALGCRDVFAEHCRSGFLQYRIASRAFDVSRVSEVATLGITDRHQVVGKCPPRLRVLGLEFDGPEQCLDGLITAAEFAQRNAVLIVCGGPFGLRVEQALEFLQCGLRITGAPQGDGEEEACRRMVWDSLENLLGLLGCEHGIAVKQMRGVLEGGLQRSPGFGILSHCEMSPLTCNCRRR